jgi:hypothetical protein
MHGGGPKVVAGKDLPEEYTKENLALVEKGCENMVHLIGVIRKSGINPVVCINRFYTDTDAEVAVVKKPPKPPARAVPNPTTGSRAAKAHWSSPMRSSTPATKRATSNSSIRWR